MLACTLHLAEDCSTQLLWTLQQIHMQESLTSLKFRCAFIRIARASLHDSSKSLLLEASERGGLTELERTLLDPPMHHNGIFEMH